MKTLPHLIFSLALAAALFPMFGWGAAFAIAGGVLIDIDHYIWYALKYKKFSIMGAYRFFLGTVEKNDYSEVEGSILILHTVEFLAVMAVLSFYSKYALIFMIGLLGHYLMDFVWFKFIVKKFILKYSIVYWAVKAKSKTFK